MSALSIQVPFPVFNDRDGQPLDNGYVWIGVPNLPPQTNPVNVYFDEALTILAPQPLRTINGYISRAGSPAQVYIDGVNFSILVLDSKGTMVYNFPEGTGISPNAAGVVYDPAGIGAVPTTVQAKLRETVSVKDFGAVGDGVTDDTAAIRAAVTAANATGIPLLVNPGTYFINSPANIELRVSMDATGATFKLGTGMGTTTVFVATGNPLENITSSVTLSEFKQGAMLCPSLAPYVNGYLRILSNVPNVKRLVTDTTLLTKNESGYVSKEGLLATPIRHDYSTGGTITQVSFRKDETQQMVLKGGAVDVNGRSQAYFLTINRNGTRVCNWTILDSTNSPRIDLALLFQAITCANIVYEDFVGDSMKQSIAPASTSGTFNTIHVYNINFSRIVAIGGWGSIGGNNINGYHIRDSVIDRFDIHYDCYDASMDRCTYDQAVQFGCGGGYLSVTNSLKIVKTLDPVRAGGGNVPSAVSARGDYGGFWAGNVYVSNLQIYVAEDISFSVLGRIRVYNNQTTGNYGTAQPLPEAQGIVIRDVKVTAPANIFAQSSFGVIGVRLDGNVVTASGTPGRIPPTSIVVDNLTISIPQANQSIAKLLTTSSYQSSIAAGFVAPRVPTIDGTMDSTRGQFAVDNQLEAATNTRIASGDYSTIGGGRSNEASGENSWIPGGSMATTRGRNGSWAYGSNPINNIGRYQASGIVLQAQTTDATPTRLVSGDISLAASAANQMSFPLNAGATFTATVIARAGNGVKGWKVEGVIRNTNGTFTLAAPAVVTVIAETTNAVTWQLAVTADDTLDALDFTATGVAGNTINWTARVEAVEQA
jgi:hypothetical protein